MRNDNEITHAHAVADPLKLDRFHCVLTDFDAPRGVGRGHWVLSPISEFRGCGPRMRVADDNDPCRSDQGDRGRKESEGAKLLGRTKSCALDYQTTRRALGIAPPASSED